MNRLALIAKLLTVCGLAWGALSFGAVYPWAYWPLAAILAIGGVCSGVSAGPVNLRMGTVVVLALIFAAAIAFQLVPIPLAVIARISPETLETLKRLDLGVSIGIAQSHALSIDPESTLAGFTLFLACTITTIGTAALCSRTGTGWLASCLTTLAVVLALIGIIQSATFNGKVYGFWTPIGAAVPFGPFINRNHFAGWMMMTLPVTLSLLCARIDRGVVGVKAGFRDRVLWLGSRAASELILLGAAAVVMALSLVLTFSRSGIFSFTLSVTVTGLLVFFRVPSGRKRAVAIAYLAVLSLLVVGWIGSDRLFDAFSNTHWSNLGDRRGPWSDALRIAGMFPITGTGFGGYGTATTLYQRYDLEWHYAQAHNDYLQLVAEGGVLLTIPAALLAAAIASRIVRRVCEPATATSRWVRLGALTGIMAICLQEIVDFSLQMPGNAALFAVLLGIALHRSPVAIERHNTT